MIHATPPPITVPIPPSYGCTDQSGKMSACMYAPEQSMSGFTIAPAPIISAFALNIDSFPGGVDLDCKDGMQSIRLYHRGKTAYFIVHCKDDKRLYRIHFR